MDVNGCEDVPTAGAEQLRVVAKKKNSDHVFVLIFTPARNTRQRAQLPLCVPSTVAL